MIAGEASSHCVKALVEDIVDHLARPERIVLLTDCMSSVGGFQAQHEAFLVSMGARGVQLAITPKLLPTIRPHAR